MPWIIPIVAAVGSTLLSKSMEKGGQLSEVRQPSSVDQANQLYGQVQNGLGQQQDFVKSIMGAGDLGQQQAQNAFHQQQLADMLMNQSQGNGPNPAMAQFNNTTGQNIASQAALMGSQRGAGANAGLLARQAGYQGAGIQQNAVGQGAALQAQQQLGAEQALMGQQNSIANQQAGVQGQQQAALNAYSTVANAAQQNTLNSINGQNSANVGSTASFNQANTGAGGQQAGLLGNGFAGNAIGGATSAIGGLFAGGGKAHGGMIESGPRSHMGKMMKNGGQVAGKAKVKGDNTKNDTVQTMLSPGEIVIPRSIVQGKNAPDKAAEFVRQVLAKHGLK